MTENQPEQPPQPQEPYPYPMDNERAETPTPTAGSAQTDAEPTPPAPGDPTGEADGTQHAQGMPAGELRADATVSQDPPPRSAVKADWVDHVAETTALSHEEAADMTKAELIETAQDPSAAGSADAGSPESTAGAAEPVPADEPVIITPVGQPPVGDPTAGSASGDATDGGQSAGSGAAPQPEQGDQVSGTAPVTMAEATSGGDPALSSVTVHPGILVRLRDIYAIVENWFARNPAISRELGADLKGAVGNAERLNDVAGAAPVGDTTEQTASTE
jgi:hypothetical protein